jgi:hypothetical protein
LAPSRGSTVCERQAAAKTGLSETIEAAQEEARRIAGNNPGTDAWVTACRTVETHRGAPADSP